MPFAIKFAADVRQHLEALTREIDQRHWQDSSDSSYTNRSSKHGIENLCARILLLLGSYESETSGSSMKSFLVTLASSASWP
jgi:hypothetical protein